MTAPATTHASSQPSAEPVTRITVDGADLGYARYQRLSSLRVEREFRVPGRLTMHFDYPHRLDEAESPTDYLIGVGKAISVTVDGVVLITAAVSALELAQTGEGNSVVVTALDGAHALSRVASPVTYTKVDVAAVVKQIAGAVGLTATVTSVPGTMDYLLQVETAAELLNALADRTGFDWWVHEKVLHFEKPAQTAPVALELGEDLASWRVRVTEPAIRSATVRARLPHVRAEVVGTASSPTEGVAASSGLVDLAQEPKHLAGKVLVAAQPADTQQEATGMATGLVDRAAAAAVVGQGVAAVLPSLGPGSTVKLSAAGVASGTYPVTSVEHLLRGRQWETRFRTGSRTPTGLVDLLGPSSSPSFKQLGLVAAFVTNNNDPQSLGRVKVTYPELEADGKASESDWARVISVGGGAKRGQVSLPEVDDEVLVGFENGNLRHPVVIGGLYGDKAAFPGVAPKNGKVPSRQITSRLGHLIELGDGEGPADQYVKVVVADGPVLRLGKDKSEITVSEAGKEFVITCGGATITMDGKGTIALKGKKVTIDADTDVAIAGLKVTVDAKTELAMAGKAKAGLAGAQVEVAGQAMTKISGGVVQVN